MTDFWRDLIAVASVFVTLVGFILALWQLRKTRSAAEKAREAAERSREESRRDYHRYVVANLPRLLDGAKRFVDANDWQGAILRLSDIAEHVAQLADLDGDWNTLAPESRIWEDTLRAVARGSIKEIPPKKWKEFVLRLHTKIDQYHGPFKGPDPESSR